MILPDEKQIQSFNTMLRKQLKHYIDLSLVQMLKAVDYTLLSLEIEEQWKCVDEIDDTDIARIPVIKMRAASHYGAISYHDIYPRFLTDDSAFDVKECKDVFVRFSITKDGCSFHRPCWTQYISSNGIYTAEGRRVDWDFLDNSLYNGEIRGKAYFNKVTSSVSSMYAAALKFFACWLDKGVSHPDFDI